MMNMQSICVDKIQPSELFSWWWLVYLLNSLSTSINRLHCYWAKALLVMAWIWQSVACAPPVTCISSTSLTSSADTMNWLTERRQSNRWLWAGALMYHFLSRLILQCLWARCFTEWACIDWAAHLFLTFWKWWMYDWSNSSAVGESGTLSMVLCWHFSKFVHTTKICQGFSLMQTRAKSNWQELNISLLHTHLRRR